MPEFFIELFSEEIPARMQARAADDLARLLAETLAPLSPADIRTFSGPRRIALAANVAAEIAASRSAERGPRKTAPEQALTGFLRKHGASRDQLREEGDFLVLDRVQAGIGAAALIAREMPGLLRRFPWPKSMRWGGTSQFTWIRPLRRIVCLLDGDVVAFNLRHGDDDGHGLASGRATEGHRFMAPGGFDVASASDWCTRLRERRVIVDAAERRAMIAAQIQAAADGAQLTLVDDPGLLDEVAGLVEWPVALLGRIDAAFMDLPAEVMQVSMRVNQRYFALRDAQGHAAPAFVFVSNIEATDGGATGIAGNERVLRARFSDARHFWDLDRERTLESRVAALESVTFHAKLGSQGDRVRRLVRLAGVIAPLVGADTAKAERAALLAKADLTTGMVGEFPELQGVMGRYYVLHDRKDAEEGRDAEIADAVRDHYLPKGQGDSVPSAPVSIAVALADKIDQIVQFFWANEQPTGSSDPYALRRAALGIIRILRETKSRIALVDFIGKHADLFRSDDAFYEVGPILKFFKERFTVALRSEGFRHDVIDAAFATSSDFDVVAMFSKIVSITEFISTHDGSNLLAAYRRASSILRKERWHDQSINMDYLRLPEEQAIANKLFDLEPSIGSSVKAENYAEAMSSLATLRGPLDIFFDRVTVNDPDPDLRRNRLGLLWRVRDTMDTVADFSKIEGT